jgi:flagellar hook assembly protein FlgD
VTGTAAELSLERPAHVSVRVFDLGGRLIRVLEDRALPSGRHEWAWDGRDVRGADAGSGVFYLEATADGERMVRPVVKLR